MSEAAHILLQVLRYANRNNIDLPLSLVQQLIQTFQISPQEGEAVMEIIKADARERFVNSPHFGAINQQMSRMSKDNPEGR